MKTVQQNCLIWSGQQELCRPSLARLAKLMPVGLGRTIVVFSRAGVSLSLCVTVFTFMSFLSLGLALSYTAAVQGQSASAQVNTSPDNTPLFPTPLPSTFSKRQTNAVSQIRFCELLTLGSYLLGNCYRSPLSHYKHELLRLKVHLTLLVWLTSWNSATW